MQHNNRWRNLQSRQFDNQGRQSGYEPSRYDDLQPQELWQQNQQRPYGAYEGNRPGAFETGYGASGRGYGSDREFEQDYRSNPLQYGPEWHAHDPRGYREDPQNSQSEGRGQRYGNYQSRQGYGYEQGGHRRDQGAQSYRGDEPRGGYGAGHRSNYGDYRHDYAGDYRLYPGSQSGRYSADEYRRYGGGFYGSDIHGGPAGGGSGEPLRGSSQGFYGGQFSGYDYDRQVKPMRNRGPKNYTRSDDRIQEDVNDRLMQTYDMDAGDVEVKVSQGEVTLSGTVDSRQAKFHAEQIAEAVLGVKDVSNQLRVKREDRDSSDESRSRTQQTTSSNASSGSSSGSGKRGSYAGSAG